MKSAVAIALASASLVVAVAFAAPAPSTAATHYTVHCVVADGTRVIARAFDRSVVERAGGKAHAIELFKQKHPGATCWVTGPHRDRR